MEEELKAEMWTRLAPSCQTRAVWYINQEVQQELMTMVEEICARMKGLTNEKK